jgi:hypothetical protein
VAKPKQGLNGPPEALCLVNRVAAYQRVDDLDVLDLVLSTVWNSAAERHQPSLQVDRNFGDAQRGRAHHAVEIAPPVTGGAD